MQVFHWGRVEYLATYEAMQTFTEQRQTSSAEAPVQDQLWMCEHPPVYTQGLAGKAEHIFNPANIPVVQTNRGGQVTYHGPGQVLGYPLIDLKRAGYFVKEYVYRMEEAVNRTLLYFGVTGHRVAGAPGIYVRLSDPFGHAPLPNRPSKRPSKRPANHPAPNQAQQPDFAGLGKIAALGIKVRRNCSYHGVALNVAMDLEPFARINPCGYVALKTVDLSTIGLDVSWQDAADVLSHKLTTYLAP
ncbi:MAG: lipoyl(octanoyl) transferase LipB [Rhodoferax sp.]|nr:lipoyl(octanoyl) transferase LipB [Rhodoferax sp.]